MPATTNSNASSQPLRIPAWQKLGLKLKSAQRTTPETTIESSEAPKRKRSASPGEITKQRKKKAKIGAQVAQDPEPITPNLARKKSVTFTPETKADDGDSIKQLFTSWVAEQKVQDPSFQLSTSAPVFQTPAPPQIEEQVDPKLDEKERRVKRVKVPKKEKAKKQKSQLPSKVIKPTTPSRPFLEYLKQYSESRATWKFNKNHQNHIIKHIFNIEVIPSDHAHFIYGYVRGLQGGVRTRLRDAALAIKVKDIEDGVAGFPADMAQPEKRQREYDAAMSEYVATMTASSASSKMGYEEGILLGLSNAAMENRVAKRMRAEKILSELATSPDASTLTIAAKQEDEAQKRLRMNDGTSQKIARKRKQRTVAAEDESSSSSESESDSDSDSSDSDDSSSEGTIAQQGGPDDTSSSSSSSSSEADSDSEESESDSEDDSEDSESE